MKKLHSILLALLLAVTVFNVTAQTATDDADEALRRRINNAVMGVYNEHLAKNPNDYSTLHMRAGQYFNFGKTDSALLDINRAIELTPKKEKELLLDEYMLRAAIYDRTENYQAELEDLNAAAALNPSSPAIIEMMARLGYKTGDYESAAANYSTLLRRDARNYNAMYGMAQVEVKRNNYGDALTWVDKAIELYPANATVYMNKASVLEQMGQPTAAAQTYLIAMASTDDNGMAIQRLFELSDNHYSEVMSVLRQTTDNAPRAGVFYRIRSSIAIKHLHYGQAMKDLASLIDNDLMNHDAVYADAALCQYHLANFDAALNYINKALELNPDDALYHVQHGDILAALGKQGDAISAYDQALELDAANYADAYLGKARIYIAAKKNDLALTTVNEGLAAIPASSDLRLTRVWLYKYRLNQADNAKGDLQLILNYGDESIYSLRGFALHENGDDEVARQWIDQIINDNIMTGGESYYYAAVLMSYIGDNEKAMSYWTSALANGYGSKFEATVNEAPYLNLRLIRTQPNFDIILQQNDTNFEVK